MDWAHDQYTDPRRLPKARRARRRLALPGATTTVIIVATVVGLAANGCDSTVNITLSINPSIITNLNANTCSKTKTGAHEWVVGGRGGNEGAGAACPYLLPEVPSEAHQQPTSDRVLYDEPT